MAIIVLGKGDPFMAVGIVFTSRFQGSKAIITVCVMTPVYLLEGISAADRDLCM